MDSKAQKRVVCDGQNTYNAETVEHIVVEIIKTILRNFKQTPKDATIEWRVSKHIFELQKAEKEKDAKLKKQQNQLITLQAEVGKCLLGESSFTEDVLAASIQAVKGEIEQSLI